MWESGVDWDDLVEESLLRKAQEWFEELSELPHQKAQIRRLLTMGNTLCHNSKLIIKDSHEKNQHGGTNQVLAHL